MNFALQYCKSFSSWPFQYFAVDCFLLASTLADPCFSLPFPAKSSGDGNNNSYYLWSISYILCTKQWFKCLTHIFSYNPHEIIYIYDEVIEMEKFNVQLFPILQNFDICLLPILFFSSYRIVSFSASLVSFNWVLRVKNCPCFS